jgi:hypothetical protein
MKITEEEAKSSEGGSTDTAAGEEIIDPQVPAPSAKDKVDEAKAKKDNVDPNSPDSNGVTGETIGTSVKIASIESIVHPLKLNTSITAGYLITGSDNKKWYLTTGLKFSNKNASATQPLDKSQYSLFWDQTHNVWLNLYDIRNSPSSNSSKVSSIVTQFESPYQGKYIAIVKLDNNMNAYITNDLQITDTTGDTTKFTNIIVPEDIQKTLKPSSGSNTTLIIIIIAAVAGILLLFLMKGGGSSSPVVVASQKSPDPAPA